MAWVIMVAMVVMVMVAMAVMGVMVLVLGLRTMPILRLWLCQPLRRCIFNNSSPSLSKLRHSHKSITGTIAEIRKAITLMLKNALMAGCR